MIQTRRSRVRDLGLLVLLLTAGFVWPSASTPAQVASVSVTTIKNFGKVNDQYYRGSQPREKDIEQLKQLGIQTVIDLRKDKEPREEEWVKRAGLRYFNIPLLAGRGATDSEAARFLSLVNDPENGVVYVHCKGGKHRTGALTAAYRITHDGWTADQAFEEMKHYDFNDGLLGGPSGQKKFVYSFYEKFLASRKSDPLTHTK
jgi:protein tyrosine/serine phosphatase